MSERKVARPEPTRVADAPVKFCHHCGRVMRYVKGDKNWARRRFCNLRCASSASPFRQNKAAPRKQVKGPRFTTEAEHIAHYGVTQCPPAYAYGASSFGETVRPNFIAQRRGR